MNVRGWDVGKMEDLSREMNEWNIDVACVTETQLRERVELESESFRMRGKGSSKQQRKGGGVGIMVKLDIGVDIEEIDVGECEMSEDIVAIRLEYTEGRDRERIILIVCYMTVERAEARTENERKYIIVER